MCTSFLGELLSAQHQFGASTIVSRTSLTAPTGDTFKAALYLVSATYNAATTAYSATGEVSGAGYTAGGVAVTTTTTPTPTKTPTPTPTPSNFPTEAPVSIYNQPIVGYVPGTGNTVEDIVTFDTNNPIWMGNQRGLAPQPGAITLGGFNGLNS